MEQFTCYYRLCNSFAAFKTTSNVQICLHSCCVIVLDVFFLLLLCFYIVYSCHVSTVLCHYCFMDTSVQEFLPWCSSSVSEINWNETETESSFSSAITHLGLLGSRRSKTRLMTTSLVLLCDRVTCSITGHITRRQLPPRTST